jgi:hypothetical protein
MDDHNLFLKGEILVAKRLFLSGEVTQKCPQMARFL